MFESDSDLNCKKLEANNINIDSKRTLSSKSGGIVAELHEMSPMYLTFEKSLEDTPFNFRSRSGSIKKDVGRL